MFLLVYTVYCQKQPPEQRCSVKKGGLKKFVNFIGKHLCCLESLFNKVTGLKPILKNICKRLLLHYTRTTHCQLSILLYIQQLLPHHHCYYCNTSMFVFGSNGKSFKEFKFGISFSLSHFHRCSFPFSCFFCLSQFCFIFCRCS